MACTGCTAGDLSRGDFASTLEPSDPFLSNAGLGMLNFVVVVSTLPLSPGVWNCANPAAIPVLVCIHLKNGLVCKTTLYVFFLFWLGPAPVPFAVFPASDAPDAGCGPSPSSLFFASFSRA